MTDENLDTENQEITPDIEESQAESVADDDSQKPVFNKIQMADVVKRERAKAYEKAKKELLMELGQQQGIGGMVQANPGEQQQSQGLGGMAQQMSPDQIRQMIAEQAPHVLNEQIANFKNEHMVNSFVSKMQAAEQRFPGLEQKLNKLDYNNPTMIKLVGMANEMENTGDIMNELLANPMKMGTVLNLAKEQPFLASETLKELSNSIKQNQQALAEDAQARDPMRQLKPSSVGMDNGKAQSVADFKKMFKA